MKFLKGILKPENKINYIDRVGLRYINSFKENIFAFDNINFKINEESYNESLLNVTLQQSISDNICTIVIFRNEKNETITDIVTAYEKKLESNYDIILKKMDELHNIQKDKFRQIAGK